MLVVFLIFCIKLQQHKVLKLTSLIFWRDLLDVSRQKRAYSCPKMTFLDFYGKLTLRIFDFLHDVPLTYEL